MLDGSSFLKAGWVHNLRLHQFSSTGDVRFLIMGKVNEYRTIMQMDGCNFDILL